MVLVVLNLFLVPRNFGRRPDRNSAAPPASGVPSPDPLSNGLSPAGIGLQSTDAGHPRPATDAGASAGGAASVAPESRQPEDTRDAIPLNRTFRVPAAQAGTVHAALFDWDVWADDSRPRPAAAAAPRVGAAGR